MAELGPKNLIIDDLPNDYEEGMGIQLHNKSVIMPLRLQLVGDEIESRKWMRVHEKNRVPTDAELRKAIIARMIEGMTDSHGDKLSYEDRLKFVRSKNRFTATDLTDVFSFEKEFSYGVHPYRKFECHNDKCGEKSNVAFNLDIRDFFPEGDSSRHIRVRILSKSAFVSATRKSQNDGLHQSNLDKETSSEGTEETQRASRTGEEDEGSVSPDDQVVRVSDVIGD